jgi:hypothetical protein
MSGVSPSGVSVLYPGRTWRRSYGGASRTKSEALSTSKYNAVASSEIVKLSAVITAVQKHWPEREYACQKYTLARDS